MPEIQIRPAVEDDIPRLIALDHDYTSDFVWQMDILSEDNQVGVSFREIKLPRSVRVDYPRPPADLAQNWDERSALLVACLEDEPVGYVCAMHNIAPATTWITDLVVMRRVRRQGIGSTLVLAAQEWARQARLYRLVLEMQPKNFPAISLAKKMGFDFCGYNDRYYANHDIALFFAKSVR